MQLLRHVRQRHSKNSSATNPFSTTTTTTTTYPPSTAPTSPVLYHPPPQNPFLTKPTPINTSNSSTLEPIPKTNAIVSSFRDWFLSRKDPFLEQIYKILKTQEGFSLDSSLYSLQLRLSESLVLQVLNYNKHCPDVLCCLKFFDWSGRQKGFYHTKNTFCAIFKILCKTNFMPLFIEFLDCYFRSQNVHKVRFYNTLVIGYSVAGMPETALRIFGRMRFQGMDLNSFGYNALLNALVEEGDDDGVEMVVKQIQLRGMENLVTHSIMTKNFCKKREFDKGEEYLRGLSGGGLSGVAVAEFVDALCKDKQFRRAAVLVEDLKKSCNVPLENVYGVWVIYLVKDGKVGGALEFLKDKRIDDKYVPNVFHSTSLVNRLLQEKRLEEVFDLLTDMREQRILPDELTMNYVLCFFCKAGMVDAAVELYGSRAEYGMSVSGVTYNYLIKALVGEVSVDEAYQIFATATDQGCSPGEKTISIIAESLLREGKHEKMKNLVEVAMGNNFKLKDSTYSKFISPLCSSRRVEDGYMVQGYLNRSNKETSRMSYLNLIKGFNHATRGDIAARLLIEMQEKGHIVNPFLFRTVISCLCRMDNPEVQVLRFLQMQLYRHEPSTLIFNHFIYGTGHAGKPEISRKVYEVMRVAGISPNFESHVLLLKSYVKSEKITDALIFFHGLPEKSRMRKKLWSGMIIGLCKVERLDSALELFWKMRASEMKPSTQCYEELVKLLCHEKKYVVVFSIMDDMAQASRRISPFIGNVLLSHCLYSPKVFDAWLRSRNTENQTPDDLMLGKLIGFFSGCINGSQDIEDMEELLKQCFKPDLYSYNMLLRRLILTEIDHACEYVNRIREKGYEPNVWTYDAIVHGYYKHGMDSEARKWRDMMLEKGFSLRESTQVLLAYV